MSARGVEVMPRDRGPGTGAYRGLSLPGVVAEDSEATPAGVSTYEQVRASLGCQRHDIARAKRLRRLYDEPAFVRKAGGCAGSGSAWSC